METCYVHRNEVKEEELIEIYTNKILESSLFDHEICIDQISITEGFIVYPILSGSVKNLEYLILRSDKQKSGRLDVSCSLAAKNFLLYEYSTRDFIEEAHSLDEYAILNKEEVEASQKEFIQRLLDRATEGICKRHNLILTERKNAIDISPIKTLEDFQENYYLEQVFQIEYFSKKQKKPWRSLYSTIQNDFYVLDYPKSSAFEEFYKRYKRPIVYLPKEYLPLYYEEAFRVYEATTKELNYIKEGELLAKLRKHVKYEEYTKHREYLEQLIFYFRRREYLKEYTNEKTGLRQDIFFSYLTLRYNPKSGYHLATLCKDHLVEDNPIRLYQISAKLGNSLAKKALYEYYSEPKTYNEHFLKRYS